MDVAAPQPPSQTSEFGARWFVVQTRMNQEEKAAQNLRQQGYGVYLPRYLKRRRHARRVDIVTRPLYPRYLFVAFDPERYGWRAINSTFGVSHIVQAGERPAEVDARIVETIRSRENDDHLIELDPLEKIRAGDRVEVMDGAFASHLGLYEGVTANQRVTILLDLLGRQVRIAIDRTAIEPAEN